MIHQYRLIHALMLEREDCADKSGVLLLVNARVYNGSVYKHQAIHVEVRFYAQGTRSSMNKKRKESFPVAFQAAYKSVLQISCVQMVKVIHHFSYKVTAKRTSGKKQITQSWNHSIICRNIDKFHGTYSIHIGSINRLLTPHHHHQHREHGKPLI